MLVFTAGRRLTRLPCGARGAAVFDRWVDVDVRDGTRAGAHTRTGGSQGDARVGAAHADKPAHIVPNVERRIVARIEKLEEAVRDPSGERVRVEAQDLSERST
jgi:hypothetical protein